MKYPVLIFLLLAFTLTASAQKDGMQTAELDGLKIRYHDRGDQQRKEALVLVHCWTCSSDFWKGSIDAFPQYRVIAMDLPGHGASDKPEREYSIEYFAEAVKAVMDKAGVKRAVLAGHSMGTPVVRSFYEKYPDRTLALIFVDGALVPFGSRADVDQFFSPLFSNYKAEAPKFVNGMLPADKALAGKISATMLATPDHVGISSMKKMLDYAYAEHQAIKVPSLALMAPSPYWPKDLEAQYRVAAPDLEFQMWSGVSHFLHMERPAIFNGQVKGFIIRRKLL